MRPGRRVPPGTDPRATADRACVEVGDDLGGGRAGSVRLEVRRRRPVLAATARSPCRRTSTAPLDDPERYQTVYARRRVRWRRRRPACTSPTACSTRCRGRGRRGGGGRARRSGWARSVPSPRSGSRTTAMHAEGYDVPADVLERVPSRRAGGRRRHDGRCGRSSRRRPPASPTGRTELFIHGDYEFAGGRRAPHQLPRAPVVAARAGRRVRRARGGDGSTTTALRRGLPLPLASATRCCSTAGGGGPVKLTVDIEAHRRRGAHRRGDHATGPLPVPCFMPVGTRGAVRALSSTDLEELGLQVVLGQHLPPDAAAGRRRGRRRSAGCTASWGGTVTC